jgi:anti-sigma factor RsiW
MMHDHASCQKLLSSLSEYIDGTLGEALCHALEQHLDGCQNCQVVLDTMKKTILVYQATADPDSLPGDVRQRLFVSLNLEDYINKEDNNVAKAA